MGDGVEVTISQRSPLNTFSQPGEYYIQSGIAIVMADAFAVIGFPSISLWAAVGAKIRVWLSSPTRSGGSFILTLGFTQIVDTPYEGSSICQIHVP